MSELAQFAISVGGFLFAAIGTWIAANQFFQQALRDKQQQLKILIDEKADAKTKEYAAQRDFAHLERRLAQLQVGQEQLMKEIDLRIDKLERRTARLTTAVQILTHQVTGESVTGLLNQEREE